MHCLAFCFSETKLSNCTSLAPVNCHTHDPRYTVGQPFSPSTLTAVKAAGSTSAFSGWFYGKQDPLNLLGTIKSLDELGVETLNCTMNNATHVSVTSLPSWSVARGGR